MEDDLNDLYKHSNEYKIMSVIYMINALTVFSLAVANMFFSNVVLWSIIPGIVITPLLVFLRWFDEIRFKKNNYRIAQVRAKRLIQLEQKMKSLEKKKAELEKEKKKLNP